MLLHFGITGHTVENPSLYEPTLEGSAIHFRLAPQPHLTWRVAPTRPCTSAFHQCNAVTVGHVINRSSLRHVRIFMIMFLYISSTIQYPTRWRHLLIVSTFYYPWISWNLRVRPVTRMPSGIYVSGQDTAIYQNAKTLSNFCNELKMKAIFKHPVHQRRGEKKQRSFSV